MLPLGVLSSRLCLILRENYGTLLIIKSDFQAVFACLNSLLIETLEFKLNL